MPIDKARIVLILIGYVDSVPLVNIKFSTLLEKPKKLPELIGDKTYHKNLMFGYMFL